MKTNFYILLLLLALGFNSSFAQPYKPCLDGEIIRWSVVGIFDNDGPIESRDIVAYGDTSFNGVVYKYLFQDWTFDGLNNTDENNINWQSHIPAVNYPWENHYIRESEDASKLYMYNSETNEEYILSDMNLQKGDTFQIMSYYYGMTNATVDSVYFKNELKHIALNTGSTLIETIGENMWYIGFNGEKVVNCFQNQTVFYKNNEDGIYGLSELPCGGSWGGGVTKSDMENNIQLFVHREKIEVVFSDNVNVDIFVYDVYGRLCYNKNDVFDRKMFIPTAAFSNGVYIVGIIDRQTHQTISKKVMIR